MAHIVYRATNTLNGRVYIGYTGKSLPWRRRAHINKAISGEKGCPKFHAAIRKYGAEAFVWEEIALFQNARDALAFEVTMIAEDNPHYNITLGGEGARGLAAHNRTKILCLEDGTIFESITAAAKNYGMSVANIQGAVSGKKQAIACNRHFIKCGKKMSKQERANRITDIDLEAARKRKRKEININVIQNGRDALGRSAAGPAKNSKPVICVSDGRIFPSASAAAAEYKMTKTSIIQVCLKQPWRNTAGGRVFEYIKVN